jgi:hypothetical protein
MMIRKTVSFIVFTLMNFCLPAVGQTKKEPSPAGKYAFTVAYFGEMITHPGATLGIERYLLQDKRYRIFLGANLGMYTHTRNHTAYFINIQSGQRLTTGSGLFFDQSIGIGYLRSYLNGGDIFEVDAFRGVYESKNSGRGHVMPSVSLGTGWDFSKKNIANLAVFVRPQVFWQYPFNNYSLVHLALQTGLTFHFNRAML